MRRRTLLQAGGAVAAAATAAAGAAGYEADVWYGLFAPAGLPDALLQAVHAAMRRASATPAFERRAAQEGLQLTREDPAATERIVREERAKWLRLVQAQSIKAE